MTSLAGHQRRLTRWVQRLAFANAAAAFVGLLVAAFLPVTFDSREEVFEIPNGTWSRRMAGQDLEILPSEITLVAGGRDVLVLRNLDDVPQIFGPTLLMPGQTFKLPFHEPSENLFTCTAHASGQIIVTVEEAPTTPWMRVTWRLRSALRKARLLQARPRK
jgi:hypothetical protein